MKALAITLCFLIIIPAGAQQIVAPQTPNFYVPYAVSLSAAAENAYESSSDDARIAAPEYIAASPQHRYPIRRPYPSFGPRYAGYPPPSGPPVSTRTILIISGAVAGFVTLYVVTAPH